MDFWDCNVIYLEDGQVGGISQRLVKKSLAIDNKLVQESFPLNPVRIETALKSDCRQAFFYPKIQECD